MSLSISKSRSAGTAFWLKLESYWQVWLIFARWRMVSSRNACCGHRLTELERGYSNLSDFLSKKTKCANWILESGGPLCILGIPERIWWSSWWIGGMLCAEDASGTVLLLLLPAASSYYPAVRPVRQASIPSTATKKNASSRRENKFSKTPASSNFRIIF